MAATAAASAQIEVERAEATGGELFVVGSFLPALDHVQRHLSTYSNGDPALQRASEWVLDNMYLLRRVARQVAHGSPPGFVQRLPTLASGPAQGLPRVLVLSREIVAAHQLELGRHDLHAYLTEYQAIVPLSIAELWALPVVLQASLLRSLLCFLVRLGVPIDGYPEDASFSRMNLDASEGVERAVRALRVMVEVEWKEFFEENSLVEAALREDPAGVYAGMDFNTCDAYRKAVEDLAWNSDFTEIDVTHRALVLARAARDDPRRGHIGFYLVADGREALEAELGFRPRGIEAVRRRLRRHPTAAYLVPIATLTAFPMALLVGFVVSTAVGPALHVALAVAVLWLGAPALWSVSTTLVQWILARTLRPQRLPKLDYSEGIPKQAKTLVVVPTLLTSSDDVQRMLRQLELHYLSNSDPALGFALLTDCPDTTGPSDDEALLDGATEAIVALNQKHGGGGAGPFLLLHRASQWNPAEGRYMGWERKRGKLDELNRLLRGLGPTTFSRVIGDPGRLQGVRFVLTLDSDTQLPLGAAHRLVGLLDHPLNVACFDPRSGRVVAGYTVVQPRLEVSPLGGRSTRFAQICTAGLGIDIYASASTESYQDLFGAGIYFGKGIYEVDSFMRSLAGRVPENAIVSHDLFEGAHGRAALASDIVLYESQPTSYIAHMRRMHRWVRGDWQLAPWVGSHVPSPSGEKLPNPLHAIDRWKIVDNLRRSLVAPCAVGLLVAAWTFLPLDPTAMTIAVLAALVAPYAPALIARGSRRRTITRVGVMLSFLLHEASVVSDAIGRVLVRAHVTKKLMLQWTSSAMTDHELAGARTRSALWRELAPSSVLALGVAVLVAAVRPDALWSAGPLLMVWMLAPEVANWLDQPRAPQNRGLTAREQRSLRLLARKTWLFFETFVGPGDQWLPIDNYQEPPFERTAHRTSPTNIGLALLSTLAAYDFGYIGMGDLALRVRRSMDSIEKLEHFRGHVLNWYDTRSLEPLLPHYVSTVDSGNLAGCLVALEAGCREAARGGIPRQESWSGLADSVALVEESLDLLAASVGPMVSTAAAAARDVDVVLARIRVIVDQGTTRSAADAYGALEALQEETSVHLQQALLALLETGVYRHAADHLRALRASLQSLQKDLVQHRREMDTLCPWLALKDEPAAMDLELGESLRLDQIPAAAEAFGTAVRAWEDAKRGQGTWSPAFAASAARLHSAFLRGGAAAARLAAELEELAVRSRGEAHGMDFGLLYDEERRLFHLGYHVTTDQADKNHYDLLASEARLASYLAVVKNDVPEAHWYALGRPLTVVDGEPALMSWGGTMFEYLMPSLLMRSHEGTLLERSAKLAVVAQMEHGARNRVPWGVSESAYGRLDAHQNYQYQSFGVPALGFKRGLADDEVVAPYASLLAMSIRPDAVASNVERLASMGMMGRYGLYEAMDFRTNRADNQPFSVVRSYMAHHQGMILVALDNYCHEQIMVGRFHADASVSAGEMLLNERSPEVAPEEDSADPLPSLSNQGAPARPWSRLPEWSPRADMGPQAQVLGNGRLSTIVTDRGTGGLQWQGRALTRFRPDRAGDQGGTQIYLHDEERGDTWTVTCGHGQTTYAAHKADFSRRRFGISVHAEVAIAPDADVELRRVTVHNEGGDARRITLTSAAEPVLLDALEAEAHPAFSRLFVESEFVEELEALVFTRRKRADTEASTVLVHSLVRDRDATSFGGCQGDRSAFYGRCGTPRSPSWLDTDAGPEPPRVGAMIDPFMALRARMTLEPDASVTVVFVTAAADRRSAALALATQYGSLHAVRWGFDDAAKQSSARLERADLEPVLLPAVQRLFSSLLYRHTPTAPPAGEPPVVDYQPPSRQALWQYGISGDIAVVLLRCGNPAASLLREVVAAQKYLRQCGVVFDLVILDEQPSGYAMDGAGSIREALAELGIHGWLDERGGVHVLTADQLTVAKRGMLSAIASVTLETTRDGGLTPQMDVVAPQPVALPRFEPTLSAEGAGATSSSGFVPEAVAFDSGWGGFARDGTEYLIRVMPGRPTPAPWCNVLSNPSFGCLTSESSLGSTWAENAGENRLTPWRNDPVLDLPSEVLYYRDEETGEVWSATPLPAGQTVETRVRHGAGYTTYERHCHGLAQELTVFVPPSGSLKVARLRLRNTLSRPRRLTCTYYAEWTLGRRREEQAPYVETSVDRTRACLFARSGWNADFADRVAFLASERPLHGFTTDRAEFVGRDGDLAEPEALSRWGLSGRQGCTGDPCAALQIHLEFDVAGGEADELETHFVLGQASSRDEACELADRFRDPETVRQSWHELGAYWDDILGRVRVSTPDPSMDLLLNRWLVYQTLSSRLFGRTGFYQSSGAFGFRDQLQDVLALMHAAPELARSHIVEAAAHQFDAGDVLHWWHPPEGRGVRSRCSDDMAWLPFATSSYVAATGDISILSEKIPWLVGEPLGPHEHDHYADFATSEGDAPLIEHCRRALERALTEGRHGLPLMGDGDWNDGMNRVGHQRRGESVWLGWFLCCTMRRFAELLEMGAVGAHQEEAKMWRLNAEKLAEAVETSAWDGGWYLRAFHDDGSLVGSITSNECKIDSIAQSWAVLSGAANPGRALAAMAAAEHHLVDEDNRLVRLLAPPFDTTLHDPGYVRAYPPGVRENGGQYTHAAAWLGWAQAKLGDGGRAVRIFRILNPILRTTNASATALYRTEPYVLAGDVYGAPPWVGRGGWSWYTGSAGWTYRLGTEAILGLVKVGGKLCIDPCIPPAWRGFEAWVRLGHGEVHVVVDNPDGVSRGVFSATVDGTPIDTDCVMIEGRTVGPDAVREVRLRLGPGPSHPAGEDDRVEA